MATTEQRPDRMQKVTISGKDAKIRLYHDYGDYAARFELEREAIWSFGVNDAGVATLLGTTADAELTRDSIPSWVESQLDAVDVAEIEV